MLWSLLFFGFAGMNHVSAQLMEFSKSCTIDVSDRDEPRLKFTHGAFKDQCVEATSVRPPKLVEESFGQITLVGFYDRGRFWRATLPKGELVAEVLFQIVPFESGVPLVQAAHTQFRFKLKPGQKIALESQTGDPAQTAEVDDLVISSTFTAPRKVEYSAFKSLGSSYGIVTRVMSTQARALEEIQKDRSTIRQFRLKLSDVERERLLILALHRASMEGYLQSYDLLDRNCTTIVFDTLDALKAPPAGVDPVRGRWLNITDEYIEPSLRALKQRQLIDAQSEIPPMNTEERFQSL